MPQYQYTSPDGNGELQPSFIEASSEEAARDLLAQQQGITVASIELVAAQQSDSQTPPQSGFGMTSDEHVEVVGEPVRVRSNFVKGFHELPVMLHRH